jgi:hypothetical protein
MKVLFLFFLVFASIPSIAQLKFDFETGLIWNSYNDVRVPNLEGDEFSLVEGTGKRLFDFYRVQLLYTLNERHNFKLLYAPLKKNSENTFLQGVFFAGADFPSGTLYSSTYKFNSYRITYRYDFSIDGNIRWGLGLTGKVRDAKIRILGDNIAAEKTDLGLVPLINFMLEWHWSNDISFQLEGDALASPFGQGRAEDILLALRYHPSPQVSFKTGYRILEGGADVDEVYNFTLFNYLLVGATFKIGE